MAATRDNSEYLIKDGFYELPQLDIQIELTKKAEEQLRNLKERIKIICALTYNLEDLGETGKNQFTYEEPLLHALKQKEFIIAPHSGNAYLSTWRTPVEKNKKFDANLNINVISSGDTCSYNILNCSFYDNKYPEINRTIIPIECDIISEEPKCNEK